MTCIFEHDKKDMVFMRIKKKKITRASDQNPGILSAFLCRNALESTGLS